jgi:hypothetical protein
LFLFSLSLSFISVLLSRLFPTVYESWNTLGSNATGSCPVQTRSTSKCWKMRQILFSLVVVWLFNCLTYLLLFSVKKIKSLKIPVFFNVLSFCKIIIFKKTYKVSFT